jgi:DNA-binding cell septation regulator SpoVG
MIKNVQVFPLANPTPTMKARGSFEIDDRLKISFTIMQNRSTGELFVGLPSRRGDKEDPQTGKKPWYRDVVTLTDEVRDELTKVVMTEYQNVMGDQPTDVPSAAPPEDEISW